MGTTLPFRFEEEATFLRHFHPVIRLLLPFILVVPFLIIDDFYMIFSNIIFTVIIGTFAKVKYSRIFSRVLKIVPFVILITVIIPFYFGSTIIYQLNLGITFNIYEEGLIRASLLFMRIIGSIFIFMVYFSTLSYSEFIEALTTLRIPPSFVGSFVIMLHYIPIIASSNNRILEAQELRGKKITSYWQKLKTHGYIMGKSLVLNMERSEKLYESLKMRGFSGKLTFNPKKFHFRDFIIILSFLLLIISFIYIIDLKLLYSGVYSLFLP